MTPEVWAWAAKWQVNPLAVHELRDMFGLTAGDLAPVVVGKEDASESYTQSLCRLRAAQAGIIPFRNNRGAMQDATGRVVRFGLANDSAKVDDKVKSSDLIGIRPDGRFWARECKPAKWRYTATPREVAQLAFITLINSRGGDAAFSTGQI